MNLIKERLNDVHLQDTLKSNEVATSVIVLRLLLMRRSRKFCQRGPTLKSGPSSKWRFAGVSMMAQH